MEHDKNEVYLRILSDVRFVSEVFDIILNEADSFGGQMLSERILDERKAIGLEKDRLIDEGLKRQMQHDMTQDYKSE